MPDLAQTIPRVLLDEPRMRLFRVSVGCVRIEPEIGIPVERLRMLLETGEIATSARTKENA